MQAKPTLRLLAGGGGSLTEEGEQPGDRIGVSIDHDITVTQRRLGSSLLNRWNSGKRKIASQSVSRNIYSEVGKPLWVRVGQLCLIQTEPYTSHHDALWRVSHSQQAFSQSITNFPFQRTGVKCIPDLTFTNSTVLFALFLNKSLDMFFKADIEVQLLHQNLLTIKNYLLSCLLISGLNYLQYSS